MNPLIYTRGECELFHSVLPDRWYIIRHHAGGVYLPTDSDGATDEQKAFYARAVIRSLYADHEAALARVVSVLSPGGALSGAEHYFAQRMQDPEYASAYDRALHLRLGMESSDT